MFIYFQNKGTYLNGDVIFKPKVFLLDVSQLCQSEVSIKRKPKLLSFLLLILSFFIYYNNSLFHVHIPCPVHTYYYTLFSLRSQELLFMIIINYLPFKFILAVFRTCIPNSKFNLFPPPTPLSSFQVRKGRVIMRTIIIQGIAAHNVIRPDNLM